MAAKQLILPANRAFNSNGAPSAGARAMLYISETLTPASFLAEDGVTSLGPVLTANGAGRFDIAAYNDETTAYRLRIEDKNGVELDDIDPFYFGASTDAQTAAATAVAAADAAQSASDTVTANIGSINTVSGSIANVNTVAGSIANVNLTGGSIANVNNVAADLANINAAVGAVANINTVAGGIANVGTVAMNIGAVNTCVTNMAAILDAPNQATNAANSAASANAGAATATTQASTATTQAGLASTAATTAINARDSSTSAEAGVLAALAGTSITTATLNAADRTSLAALDTSLGLKAAFDGCSWKVVDYSSLASAAQTDSTTTQGFYVRSTSNTAKAWAREFTGAVSVKWFGAKGDNATDDTAAIQATINTISSASSLTRSIFIPAGTYCVTNLTITAATGLTFIGEGRTKTTVRATSTNPALSINGLWYTRFVGLSFKTTYGLSSFGVVEQDGNYDGTNTQGTQGITWEQCDFDARGTSDGIHSYAAFYMNRRGGSGAQGSENLFLNCHFYGGTQGPYCQVGFNALNNTFVGGNFQSYPNNGMYFGAGSAQIFSVGFQSTQGYTQVLNGGSDISMAGGGVNEGICIYGCRTESLRFFNGSASQRYDIRGLNQSTFSSKWVASTAYALNAVTYETTASGLKNLYVCTTAGTSGSSKPTFPDTGTVTDGTVVWTQTPITVVNIPSGEFSDRTSYVWFSNSISALRSRWSNSRDIVGPATVTLDRSDEEVLVDATSGNVTLTLPSTAGRQPGQILTIQRKDSSANTVSLVGVVDLVDNGVSTELPPGGTTKLQVSGSGTIVGSTWFPVVGDLLYTTKDTATAAAGAVSTTSRRSRITTESLTTAAGSAYTLTITNPRIRLRSVLSVNVSKSSATTGVPVVGSIVPSNGSATVEIRNIDASAAFNGTLLIRALIA